MLFTIGNPKTVKGEAAGYLTAVLHLAPATEAGGPSVCPKATPGCMLGCLNRAGRGGIVKRGETTNAVQSARVRRTLAYFQDREAFVAQLSYDLRTLRRRAKRRGLKLAVRVNGTSDLPALARELARSNPDLPFYDYTKIFAAAALEVAKVQRGVQYTFSRSESNAADVRRALEAGINVAVVFDTAKGKPLPAQWQGRTVIDGDLSDLRFLDPCGVIVGLRAKGPARRDTSGFVVRM